MQLTCILMTQQRPAQSRPILHFLLEVKNSSQIAKKTSFALFFMQKDLYKVECCVSREINESARAAHFQRALLGALPITRNPQHSTFLPPKTALNTHVNEPTCFISFCLDLMLSSWSFFHSQKGGKINLDVCFPDFACSLQFERYTLKLQSAKALVSNSYWP